MKIYQVYDNALLVLTTTDRLKMLEALYSLYKKYEEKQSWFNADEVELK